MLPPPKRQCRSRAVTRSSRRIRNLPPDPDPRYPGKKALYLPTEIRSLVASYAPGRELKQLRLVSKQWSAVATYYLFDCIYISPRSKDLEVLENIAKDPYLAKCVKELRYDTSTFRFMSYESYSKHWYYHMDSISLSWPFGQPFHSPYPWLNQYISGEFKGDEDELFREHHRDDIVKEGWRQWQQAAVEERTVHMTGSGKDDGAFFESFISGLQQMTSLNRVTLDDNVWYHRAETAVFSYLPISAFEDSADGSHPALTSGSPHARSWNLLHALPQKNDWATGRNYGILLNAPSQTRNSISAFDTRSRVWGKGPDPSLFVWHRIDDTFCILGTLASGDLLPSDNAGAG